MYDSCMATKTITLELDAYEKLKRAKRRPRESFSAVVRRARWAEEPVAGRELLDSLRQLHGQHPECFLADDELDSIEKRATNRSSRRRPAAEPVAGRG